MVTMLTSDEKAGSILVDNASTILLSVFDDLTPILAVDADRSYVDPWICELFQRTLVAERIIYASHLLHLPHVREGLKALERLQFELATRCGIRA